MLNLTYLLDADSDYLTEIVSEERAYTKRYGVPMYYRRVFEVALFVLSGRVCASVGAHTASEMFAAKVVDALTKSYDDEADCIVVVL